jgi:hypothetical protein
MPMGTDPKRELLRHAVATLAYRGGKAVRGAPTEFSEFRAGDTTRTPGQILAHIGDLLDWALSIAKGKQEWRGSELLPWNQQIDRFFAALKAFDTYLGSAEQLHAAPEKLCQGPIADGLTHVGQLTMLRRLAGAPIRGESYFVAEITVGCVGPEQAPAKKEFD